MLMAASVRMKGRGYEGTAFRRLHGPAQGTVAARMHDGCRERLEAFAHFDPVEDLVLREFRHFAGPCGCVRSPRILLLIHVRTGGVDNGLVPLCFSSVVLSDAAIQQEVESALRDDPAADAYEIDVSVQDSVVTLSGEVQSLAKMELASKVVKAVRGVIARRQVWMEIR
jgi:hypothetical protein